METGWQAECPILTPSDDQVLVSLCWGGVLAPGWLRVAKSHHTNRMDFSSQGPRSSARARCPNLGSASHTLSPARPDFRGSLLGARRVSLSPPICTSRSGGGVTGHPTQAICQPLPALVSFPSRLSSPLPFVSWSPSLNCYIVHPSLASVPAWSLWFENSERQAEFQAPSDPFRSFSNRPLRTPRSSCKIESRARRDKPRFSKQRRHTTCLSAFHLGRNDVENERSERGNIGLSGAGGFHLYASTKALAERADETKRTGTIETEKGKEKGGGRL